MPIQTRMKFGQCKNDYNTDISIVLPRALEKSPSNVILRLRGSGSKHPHILAIQAHYQWQPDHIINRCLQLNSMGGAAATTTRGAGCRETLAALDRRVRAVDDDACDMRT